MIDKEKNASATNFLEIREINNDQFENESAKQIQHKKGLYKIRKQTTIGFQRAEWQQVRKTTKQKSVQYYKEEKISFSTQLSHFRIYGPGLYLFFNFTKKVFFLFLILSVFIIIPTIYNGVVGQKYSNTRNSLSKYLGVVSIGNLKPYDQRNPSLADKLLNAIPTFLASVVFFVFLIYWNKKSSQQIKNVRISVKLLSYKVVEVFKFPKDITETQLFYFLSQFGQVKQISTVRNFKDTIFYCLKIYTKTLDAKQFLLQRQKRGQQEDEKFKNYVQKRQEQLQKLYTKLEIQEHNASKEVIKFYVTFQSPQERQKAVEAFLPYLKQSYFCFKRQFPQEFKIRGEQILLKACHTQPSGIIWQNVHITWKTRWARLLLQLLLIALLIFLGFCFILVLNILNPPITTSNIDSSSYNSISILTVTDTSILRSWCLNNNDLVSANPSAVYSLLCSKYLTSNVSRIFISILIAFGIMFIKYILKYTVLYLSKFMRYQTHVQQVVQMTKNLFGTYFFSTVFITMFMQARFDNFRTKDLVKYLSSSDTILINLKQMNDFSDLTSGWYLDVGYQIWITWIILAFTSPLLILTYHYPLKKICRWYAQKQVLKRKMQTVLQPQQFQIYDHYANLAIFLYVGFIFSPGMPSIILITTLGLGLRYIYIKYIFIKFCKIPKYLDQTLNNLMLKYLIFALFCHLIMAIWMYGVNQLFDHKDSFVSSQFYSQDDSNFKKFWLIVIKRCIDTWYISILLVFYLFYFFLWNFFLNVYRLCTKKKEVFKAPPEMLKDTLGNGGYAIGISSERSLAKSYKIQNNPEYIDVLAIIQRKLAQTSIGPKRE